MDTLNAAIEHVGYGVSGFMMRYDRAHSRIRHRLPLNGTTVACSPSPARRKASQSAITLRRRSSIVVRR